MRDRHAPRKVTDLVDLPGVRLVPVGRLDADSEGLILLSDDGDFVYRVTHPSKSVGKTYHATVQGTPDAEKLKRLARGIPLEQGGRPTAPAQVRRLGRGDDKDSSLIELILHEGRNRQVRRMLEVVGHPVQRLVRVQIGPIRLADLQPGTWRHLTQAEVAALSSGGSAAAGGTPRADAERGGGEPKNETRHRGRPRPGPQPDHGKPAPERFQVHQDRVNGRFPARGKHHPPGGRGGEGRRPRPERDR
uniref:Pseudouridine synthase n=1 Tax=uncultured Armatimonadetes bacterium TaxID=157466 RepID=A0A6J4HA01_9BACT|nr:Ribosomal large subunit pseudouridine synthase B [uncultured Armatimonadetes bacterium]